MRIEDMKKLKILLKQYKMYRKDVWTKHDIEMIIAVLELDIDKIKNK